MLLRISSAVIAVLLVMAASPAEAHRPSFGISYNSPDRAFEIEDPDISMVLYQPVSCDSSQLWLTFEALEGYDFFLQLGVPVIDRLADYRPAIALVAPGLPEPAEDLPFEVPEGLGVLVYTTDHIAEPTTYYEEFTQTSSWILVEDTVTLPASGTGYLVGWDPAGWTGKLWIAVGTLEDFSGIGIEEFMEWDHQVKDFHEVGDLDHDDGHDDEHDHGEIVEQQCPLTGDDESGGCSTAAGSGSLAMLGLLVLAVISRRVRRFAATDR